MSALVESFVQLDESAGGWSKYYLSSRNEVGIWGTASGVIGLCLGRSIDVDFGRSTEQIATMIRLAAGFLVRQQLTRGRNTGAWSITQLKTPPFVDTTTIAARALCMADQPESYPAVARAARWLGSRQLPSGGWSNLERDPHDRLVAKTCPTAYSVLTIHDALRIPTWSAEESVDLRRRLALATGSLKSAVTAVISQHVASGWGRALSDSHPDPAYTSLALTALRSAGEDNFIKSYGSSIARLYAATRNRAVGPRFDQAPWPNVRDIWTPPAPLAERFMMFFTTGWLVRALGPLGIPESAPLLDAAMAWLIDSDRGGKYFDYYNVPHNFVSMDALWACRAYLDHLALTQSEGLPGDPSGHRVPAGPRRTPVTSPGGRTSGRQAGLEPTLSPAQLALWRQAAEQLRHAINDQVSKRAGVAIQHIPSVQKVLSDLLARRSEYQRLLPLLDEHASVQTLIELDRLGRYICDVAWPDLPWPTDHERER